MCDPIFLKSFNRYEWKRFGFRALILCFIIALSISSSFKPHLGNLSLTGNAVNLQLSIHEDTHDATDNFTQIAEKKLTRKAISQRIGTVCRVLEGAGTDYCEIEGDLRVDSNSSTVYLVTPRSTNNISDSNITTSWIIMPYPRRGAATYVKNWTVTSLPAVDNDDMINIPKCSKTHVIPAILFSIGGFSGNHFHDFADLVLPLYTTSFQFRREVHFLASDYKQWWPSKFRGLLDRLSKHEIVDIDREKHVHCYHKIILGLQFHKELIVDPSSASGVSMSGFRQLLRETFSLKRKEAITWRKGHETKPRLMIISRKRSRFLTNEGETSRAARKLGYEVILAEGSMSTNMTKFAQLVNSCDVLMGIHGAGLTNMVFLPDNAILIQIIPLGGFDRFARLYFGDPAPGMNIRYLEHKIDMKESSLSQHYSIDDPVIRDPNSISWKGWGQYRAVYLDNQNVTIDIHRFRGTLSKALKLLRQ